MTGLMDRVRGRPAETRRALDALDLIDLLLDRIDDQARRALRDPRPDRDPRHDR